MHKFKLFVHSIVRAWDPAPEVSISDMDMSSNADYTLICVREVEIDIPEFDARAMIIKSLEEGIQKERADSQVRVNLLLDRISKLKAITHEVAE
jgi:hypothetical protein